GRAPTGRPAGRASPSLDAALPAGCAGRPRLSRIACVVEGEGSWTASGGHRPEIDLLPLYHERGRFPDLLCQRMCGGSRDHEHVALGRVEVHRGLAPLHERVRPGAAGHAVVAGAAVEGVVPGATVEGVVPGATVERVV